LESLVTTERRFKPPWTAERIPGGYVVKDATGQSLAYVYARETRAEADTAKVLTMDEARREKQQEYDFLTPLLFAISLPRIRTA
jgi:hypothetical protein